MAETKARGSELLRRRMSEKDIDAMVEIDQEGIELKSILSHGIPDPDGVWGVWRVNPGSLAKLIEHLIGHQYVPHLKVHPIGVPAIDEFEVQFELGSAVQH